MAREKCGHQRLALAYFSICPLCAWIGWLGFGSEYTEDQSSVDFCPPHRPKAVLRGDGCQENIFDDGSNCLIRCMNRIYGTGLAFIDNVDEVSFIGNLT